MKFNPNNFYYVFNRGNNKQIIFPQKRNYDFFIGKLKKTLTDQCDIVAYCLMPNHFHLMLYIDENSLGTQVKSKPLLQILEQKLGTLQSSYTRANNKQENKTGSLFQSKIKVIELDADHASTCFHYIHQNPLKASLAKDFSEWPYSSFHEYAIPRNDLCKKELAFAFLDIPKNSKDFLELSKNVVINENVLSKISRPATQSGQATNHSQDEI